MEDKQRVVREAEAVRREVRQLRNELEQINKEKEHWFSQRSQADKEVLSLLGRLKALKQERNAFTREVKAVKGEREKVTQEIKAKIAVAKALETELATLKGEQQVRGNPASIKAQIERMEVQIETEAMPFTKEQKLMKLLKEKKKELGAMKEVIERMEQKNQVEREIRTKKKDANVLHSKVQEKAALSQERHDQLVQHAEQVKKVREKKKGITKQCKAFKQQFKERNDWLQEKLLLLAQYTALLDKARQEEMMRKTQRMELLRREKERLVEEKLARGEKLTNEDLLALQGGEDTEN